MSEKAKQGASSRVTEINNRGDEEIWDETELREFWKEYFRDQHGNANNRSKGKTETDTINIRIQNKLMKRKS